MESTKPFKGATWTYDKGRDTLTFTRSMKMYSYSNESTQILHITPSKDGLLMRFLDQDYYNRRERWVIPGEYTISEVASYAANRFFKPDYLYREVDKDSQNFISDALLETEMWYRRGNLANLRSFPKEIFKKVPLDIFAEAGTKSYRSWMQAAFFEKKLYDDVNEYRMDRWFADGYFPSRVHSIKGWSTLSRSTLTRVIRYAAWKHDNWGLFVKQYYPNYKNLLNSHDEAWKEIDAFIKAAIKFPMTPRVYEAFDSIYNNGGSLRDVLDFVNIAELEGYRDTVHERSIAYRLKTSMLKHYSPPKISLPDHWLWANKETFLKLGVLYNCCINNWDYEKTLADGKAHVAYIPYFERGEEDRGALCYFRLAHSIFVNSYDDDMTWEISQIRSWSNGKVTVVHREEAYAILQLLRESLPKLVKKQDPRKPQFV